MFCSRHWLADLNKEACGCFLQELHSETLSVLSDLEGWSELDWAGLSHIQIRLPPVREKLRDMSHCLSDCWTTLDNTQRLLSTLTEVPEEKGRGRVAHLCFELSPTVISLLSGEGHSVV